MPTPATGDFPENWSGRVPKCGEFCMGRALREVRHCDNFAEPSCFCSLGEDPLPKNSSAFGCISSDCYLTGNEPGKDRGFPSLCATGRHSCELTAYLIWQSRHTLAHFAPSIARRKPNRQQRQRASLPQQPMPPQRPPTQSPQSPQHLFPRAPENTNQMASQWPPR